MCSVYRAGVARARLSVVAVETNQTYEGAPVSARIIDMTEFGFTPIDQEIDWNALRGYAREVSERAYAPYSNLKVGAAALVDDGRVVLGCNVENSSLGLTLCAECGLVSALHGTGGGKHVAVVVVDGSGQLLTPCGRCLQLLFENGGPDCQILTTKGAHSLSLFLPEPFVLDR